MLAEGRTWEEYRLEYTSPGDKAGIARAGVGGGGGRAGPTASGTGVHPVVDAITRIASVPLPIP
jgi:hypothetical protein